jgi:hypothetical protein
MQAGFNNRIASSRPNLNLFNMRCGRWNSFAMQAHAFEVKFDRFADQLSRFFKRRPGGDTAREVGNMRAVASCGLSKEDGVLVHFSPACFSIEVCVFGSKSIAGCPAMVTVPGLAG